jgi:hypothetical protein
MLNILFIVFASLSAQAKLFQNSYVSFELPPRWECQVEKTEWVCRSDNLSSQKEAMIVLTAKEVGPMDDLGQYETYLKTPKNISDPTGKPLSSKVRQVKKTTINGLEWVDGMHLDSEVPFYYTRYLAAKKDRIAVLVTFSAHQRFFTKYSNDFFNAVNSLRITASPQLLAGSAGLGGGAGGGTLGMAQGVPSDIEDSNFPAEPEGSAGKEGLLALAVLLLVAGAYFFLKKKKKSGPF